MTESGILARPEEILDLARSHRGRIGLCRDPNRRSRLSWSRLP